MAKAKRWLLIPCVVGMLATAGCATGDSESKIPSGQGESVVTPTEETFEGVQIQRESYEEEGGLIKVTYPQSSGLKNGQVQSKINSDLQKYGKPSEATRQNILDLHRNPVGMMDKNAGYTSDFEIKFRKGNLLNIMINSDLYTGGAHGMPNRFSYIVDMKTGTTYNLSNLFAQGSGYLYRLSQLVKEKDVKKDLDTFTPFTGVIPSDGVYLNGDGLTIFFAPYEHASYAQGFLEYNVAAKDFIDLIDLNSPFAKLWGDVKPARQKESQETLVRDLVDRYEHAIVFAVSVNHFDEVAPYLKPDSPLDQSQRELVKKLFDQGVDEQLVSYSIDHIDGNQIYLTDTVKIKNTHTTGTPERTETFRWIYTYDPATLTLTDLAAWK